MHYIKTYEKFIPKSKLDKKIKKLRDKILKWEEKNAQGAVDIEPESLKDEWVRELAELRVPINEK